MRRTWATPQGFGLAFRLRKKPPRRTESPSAPKLNQPVEPAKPLFIELKLFGYLWRADAVITSHKANLWFGRA